MECSTLGRAERMRVPSPAASTMARQLRASIKRTSAAALIAEPASHRKSFRPSGHCQREPESVTTILEADPVVTNLPILWVWIPGSRGAYHRVGHFGPDPLARPEMTTCRH